MKSKFSKEVLSILLYILLVITGIGVILHFARGLFLIFTDFNFSTVINLFTTTLYALNYYLVVKCLIGIINSTYDTPFVKENVSKFRTMGYCLLINSIFETIIGYSSGTNRGFIQLIGSDNGAVTPIMVALFVTSLMCFVMSEVFDKAIKIKNDNDLTI
ncbi:DUF2975 domain-containing protein [Paraclostridium bifermentans]|uniref:DUF2975 domain-containing protein n=1 Tax=Paraclostridium bifermentans TaxID=1490 RepID=UPI00359C1EEF